MNDSKTGNILGKDVAGVNCILPHKHKTAWDLFLKGCANNWMPTEISMADDIKQWKNGEITDDEKLLVNFMNNSTELDPKYNNAHNRTI